MDSKELSTSRGAPMPQLTDTRPAVLCSEVAERVAELARLPARQMEAGFDLLADEIRSSQAVDPLGALHRNLGLTLAVMAEMTKRLAPILVESTDAAAVHFQSAEGTPVLPPQYAKLVDVYCRLAEAQAKLGVAAVKVDDERRRRSAAVQT